MCVHNETKRNLVMILLANIYRKSCCLDNFYALNLVIIISSFKSHKYFNAYLNKLSKTFNFNTKGVSCIKIVQEYYKVILVRIPAISLAAFIKLQICPCCVFQNPSFFSSSNPNFFHLSLLLKFF